MESPFREYLNTNYVPSDAEILRIRAHLEPHEAELARLELLIHDLTIQRDRVKDYIDSHRPLVSYPRRLPQDVVEQIFLACLPAQHSARVMSLAEAPLLLCRICSAWRKIAIRMPRLWNHLHVSWPFVAENQGRKQAMAQWLERSAQLPLAVSAAYDARSDDTHVILDSFLRFSARWHSACFSNMPVEVFLHLADVEAPQLTNLRVAFSNGFSAETGTQILASKFCRGLKDGTVHMTAPILEGVVPTTPFSWGYLAHLTLRCGSSDWTNAGLSSQAAWRLLKGCAQLRSFTFDLTSGDLSWPTDILLLPNIESLFIFDHFTKLPDLLGFINCLAMPRLVRFHIDNTFPTTAIPSHCVDSLRHLAKHSPLISDLCFDSLNLSATGLIETLQLFPLLSKLQLIHWRAQADADQLFTDVDLAGLFHILAPSALEPNPCPELEELSTRGSAVENGILVDFLQQQLHYGTKLRRLQVLFWGTRPDVIPDIQCFVASGLDVSLQYSYSAPMPKSAKFTPWDGLGQ
ncbi:hypothetical protein DFH06DRAFT_1093353 [Mycena polygramma]|nr:hypothetical protein DFH06DRAFT_1093353 [Mycena polygramma]